MTVRTTSSPPALAGYTPIELIGTGGYADVFLYEQHMPNRRVAVKVLVSDVLSGEVQRRQFAAEANLMARVSTHPYIVSIFHADVAADGRPFIVMEYYPGDNYLRRARAEEFGVAEVLRVGVQVGSALETAHRAGILHRDIKPANILTSEFRRPGLADFGIASAQGPEAEETGGVSIPWSPSEAFGADELGVQSDVYSLAATLYHLLAGRSPYEIPGGDNSSLGLMARIERGQLPPLGRPDIPRSLERTLAQAMSKNFQSRPTSVVDFLRQLQGVEAELKLAVTSMELADDGSFVRLRATSDDDDATRIKGVTEIHAQSSVAIDAVPENPRAAGPIAIRRREGLLAEPDVPDTIARPRTATAAETSAIPKTTPRLGRGAWAGIAAAVVAVAVVAGVVASSGDGSTTSPTTEAAIVVLVSNRPDAVEANGASLAADGSATFNWTAPGANTGDEYRVERLDTGEVSEVRTTSITLSNATSSTCIAVNVVRGGEQDSDTTKLCVDK